MSRITTRFPKILQLGISSLLTFSLLACNSVNEVNVKANSSSAISQVASAPLSASVPVKAIASAVKLSESVVVLMAESQSALAESISVAEPESLNLTVEVINGAILPKHRVIAYYGNPLSKRMGALGEFDHQTMIAKLNKEVRAWTKADPKTPAVPALHLIAVVAQGDPGKAGKYRMIMPDAQVEKVYEWAKQDHALFFIDVQTGHDNIRNILPMFEWVLKNPDVHFGIDPEFNLISSKAKPGSRIGTYDASDINYVSGYLQNLVTKYHLPPKMLVIHRFTQRGVTNAKKIVLRKNVQIVMNMDGWGPPILKRGTYRNFIVPEPVQYTGFKLFYHNDTKAGHPLMTPTDVLKLTPQPLYIQYQ